MAAYHLYAGIRVRHGYYADRPAQDLSFVPCPGTAMLMHNLGLIRRQDGQGLTIFYDQARKDAFDGLEDLALWFKVTCETPLFASVTQLPDLASDEIVCLSAATDAGDTRLCLSRDTFLSGADVVSMSDGKIGPHLSGKDRAIRPVCLAAICPGIPGSGSPKTYELAFKVRKTVWRYLVLGGLAGTRAQILDLDGRVAFTRKPDERLSHNRTAAVFESDRPLALAQVPRHRFLLQKPNGRSNSVLVRHLPAPLPDQVQIRSGKENPKAFFSEIFINP